MRIILDFQFVRFVNNTAGYWLSSTESNFLDPPPGLAHPVVGGPTLHQRRALRDTAHARIQHVDLADKVCAAPGSRHVRVPGKSSGRGRRKRVPLRPVGGCGGRREQEPGADGCESLRWWLHILCMQRSWNKLKCICIRSRFPLLPRNDRMWTKYWGFYGRHCAPRWFCATSRHVASVRVPAHDLIVICKLSFICKGSI